MVEIIYHTAEISKDILSLEELFDSGTSDIELDFVFTKDHKPIWTHNLITTQLLDSSADRFKNSLSLFDVLDINNHRCRLLLDIKMVPRKILNSDDYIKLLSIINDYDEIKIQSLDLRFLHMLRNSNFNNIEIGFIINVLTKWFINNYNRKIIPDIDFLAISSELWEKKDGKYIEKCNELYPKFKKYAWTWSTRVESEDRINNFIEKEADGIITSNPEFVKSLIKKR